jgi:predicted DNA-binding protein
MSNDIMIRVPRVLRERYEKLDKRESWKGFPSFVREAIRAYLDEYEKFEIMESRY